MLKYIFSQIKRANKLPSSFKNFFIGGGLFGTFLLVLFLETRSVFSVFDPAATVWIQGLIPRIFDVPLSLFSIFGNFEIMALLLCGVALWVFRKEGRIFFPLAFFGMILVFELIGKIWLYHPGPPSDFFRFNLPFSFPSVHVSTDYSFPSGHVSRTTFMAIVFAFFAQKYLLKRNLMVKILVVLITFFMVFSRIYLGEHWASDTIGGLLLGGAMGFFAVSYY